MKSSVPTQVVETKDIDHYYCNRCGEEIEKPDMFNHHLEVTMHLDELTRTFIICFKCVMNWLIPKLKYPPEDIDMREG